jgi:hypothetical protein
MTKWFILLTFLTMAPDLRGNCQPKTIPGLVDVPLPVALKTMSGSIVTSLECHRSMQAPLAAAFACIKLSGLESKLRTTGGCYCYRNIAGTTKLSRHAHGTAIDINPGHVPPSRIVECFESAGFEWGGRWPKRSYDPMHYQLRKEIVDDKPDAFYTPILWSHPIQRDPGRRP